MSTADQRRQAANFLSDVLLAQTSLLARILRTNDPPSDLEFKQISSVLHAVEAEVAKFVPRDIDPSFKASVYDPLDILRAALRGAVSPLRRVPPEIISQIFSECMLRDANDLEETLWNTLDITQAPWTLARVSRRWREIALSDQKLWSCIRVDSWALAVAGRPEPTVPKLVACLLRSGEHPLSVHLTDRYPSSFGSKPLFMHLMAHAERWVYLKLVVSFTYLELTAPLKGRLPQLQTLIIDTDGPNSGFGVFDAFEVAPKLQTASLTTDRSEHLDIGGTVPHVISLPWGQLTSLVVDTVEVIKHTPRLLNCSLLSTPPSDFVRDKSVIQHTSIRALATNLTSALNQLETPSLVSLHIRSGVEPGVLSYIVAFLSRSSCSLSTLILEGTIIDSESGLRLLLQYVPNLLCFEVNGGFVVWNIVARALTLSAQHRLVPNLERIVFSIVNGPSPYRYNIEPEALLHMLESRRKGVSVDKDTKQLKSFTLRATSSTLLAQLEPRLLTLKKLGLKIIHDGL